MNNQPLKGVRILDFGWILSIPHCTAWLGTMGAEVIRVESMASIDQMRASTGLGAADGVPGINRSAGFNGLNYSKKSITINLTTPRGLALAKELVKVSDVVTENFATGVMERLGLGYEVLCTVKPDIIMLRGSTLGTTGPEKEATGWGPNACAYAGLPFITGMPGGPPADLGATWPDYMIGTMMVFALLNALYHHRQTGEGQLVEVAMAEVVTAMIPEAVLEFTMNGRETPRMGNHDCVAAPHSVYPCAGDDQWVAIAVTDEEEWTALCRTMGNPQWAKDPRFADTFSRYHNQDELDDLIADWTRRRTAYEVMHTLQAAGVAAAPVTSIFDLMEDPQVRERGFVVEMDHSEVGLRKVAGLPVKFSAMPKLAYYPAPCLGQHNEEIFCSLLGLSQNEFIGLVKEQVIY